MTTDDRPPLTWTVGAVRVTRIEESVLAIPPSFLVPDITDQHLDRQRPWIESYFDAEGNMLLSIHTFVLESADTTIVVDTCVGADVERPLPGDAGFADRLDATIEGGLAGVDVVLCTHLHFDHIGWNTRLVDGAPVPTFPNARYLFGRTELDSYDGEDRHDLRRASVDPLLAAGLVDLIDTDHRLTGDVRTIPTPGHTAGHVSVMIESNGASALITGDAFHTPLQLTHPELACTPFDADPELSTTTRRRLVDGCLDRDTLVLGTHFAPPTAGYLRTAPSGPQLVG